MPIENNKLIESHLLRTLGDNTLDLIYAKDVQGYYIFANAATADMFNLRSAEKLLGLTDFDVHPKSMAQGYYDDDQWVIAGGKPLVDREELVTDSKTSEARWHSTTKVPLLDDNNKIIGVMGITRDITQSKRAEFEAQKINIELEQRVNERTAELKALTDTLVKERNLMRTLIDSMPDNIYAKDADSKFLLANQAVAAFMGTTQQEILGKSDFDFYPEEMAQRYFDDEQAIIRSGTPLLEREEPAINQKTGGARRWLLTSKIPVQDENGNVTGLVGIGRDITKRRLAEERINYLATHDSLTDLPNRMMFSEVLNHAIESAHRYQRKIALLFIDLDRFKAINDSLGHEAGDQLLVEMANRFKNSLRASDVIARFGGDEFLVLVQEIDGEACVVNVAEKIIAAATEPVTVLGHERRVTASVGICMYPDLALDEPTLMKNADMAMYHAKEAGKNTYCFYSASSIEPVST